MQRLHREFQAYLGKLKGGRSRRQEAEERGIRISNRGRSAIPPVSPGRFHPADAKRVTEVLRVLSVAETPEQLRHKEAVYLLRRKKAAKAVVSAIWDGELELMLKVAKTRGWGDPPQEVLEMRSKGSLVPKEPADARKLWARPFQSLEDAWDETYLREFPEVVEGKHWGKPSWGTFLTPYARDFLGDPPTFVRQNAAWAPIPGYKRELVALGNRAWEIDLALAALGVSLEKEAVTPSAAESRVRAIRAAIGSAPSVYRSRGAERRAEAAALQIVESAEVHHLLKAAAEAADQEHQRAAAHVQFLERQAHALTRHLKASQRDLEETAVRQQATRTACAAWEIREHQQAEKLLLQPQAEVGSVAPPPDAEEESAEEEGSDEEEESTEEEGSDEEEESTEEEESVEEEEGTEGEELVEGEESTEEGEPAVGEEGTKEEGSVKEGKSVGEEEHQTPEERDLEGEIPSKGTGKAAGPVISAKPSAVSLQVPHPAAPALPQQAACVLTEEGGILRHHTGKEVRRASAEEVVSPRLQSGLASAATGEPTFGEERVTMVTERRKSGRLETANHGGVVQSSIAQERKRRRDERAQHPRETAARTPIRKGAKEPRRRTEARISRSGKIPLTTGVQQIPARPGRSSESSHGQQEKEGSLFGTPRAEAEETAGNGSTLGPVPRRSDEEEARFAASWGLECPFFHTLGRRLAIPKEIPPPPFPFRIFSHEAQRDFTREELHAMWEYREQLQAVGEVEPEEKEAGGL